MTANQKKFIIVTSLFTIGSIFSIWIFWREVYWLTFMLILLSAIELWIINSKKLFYSYFLILFGGVTVEIVAIYFGAWQYTKPSFLGVPLWLLPAWGNAGLISICIYKLFEGK